MSYTLIDLELTEQLPSLAVAENQKGIALILRWNGRPIGFVMRPRSTTHILEREELAQLLSQEIGTKVLQQHLRDESALSKLDSCYLHEGSPGAPSPLFGVPYESQTTKECITINKR